MNQAQIKAAIDTFCRIHGINPDSNAVAEFYCAIVGEVSAASPNARGARAESGLNLYPARNPVRRTEDDVRDHLGDDCYPDPEPERDEP